MKTEALRLADELDALHQYVPSEAPDMIRRLVEELDKPHKYDPETGEPLIDGYPLFSGLPRRKWQYLTDAEIKEIIGGYGNEGGIGGYTRELFDKIEAKIREKNEREPKENN